MYGAMPGGGMSRSATQPRCPCACSGGGGGPGALLAISVRVASSKMSKRGEGEHCIPPDQLCPAAGSPPATAPYACIRSQLTCPRRPHAAAAAPRRVGCRRRRRTLPPVPADMARGLTASIHAPGRAGGPNFAPGRADPVVWGGVDLISTGIDRTAAACARGAPAQGRLGARAGE